MDDHRIEDYLRSFRPLPPAPLPPTPLPQGRRPGRLIAVGVAAALVMGVLLAPPLHRETPRTALPPTITIGSANDLLARSSSWKAAMDDAGFAFRSSPSHAARFRRTAIQFLSQEDLSK